MPAKPDPIERLTETWEPAIRKAFLEAIRSIRDGVLIRDLVRMLDAGDVDGALRVLEIDPAKYRPLTLALEQAYEAGGIDATSLIKPGISPLGLRISPVFDVRAPSAAGWLRDYTAGLITQITDDQRAAVRHILAPLQSGLDPMATGNTPQKLALDLVGRINRATGHREGGLIGLTSQQAEWAANYERELSGIPDAGALTRTLRDARFDAAVRRSIRDQAPLPDNVRQAMVAQYRNRLLRYRGDVIALNEASTVLHQSQLEAWEQAINRGAVMETQVRRFWITAGDDRVRPTHRAVPGMNAKGVGLREPFNTPKGPTMLPGWQFDPGCRCRVRVRVVEEAAPEPAPILLRTPAPVPA